MLSLTILILTTIAMSMPILLKARETKNSDRTTTILLVIFMPIMILFLVFVFFISQMNFL